MTATPRRPRPGIGSPHGRTDDGGEVRRNNLGELDAIAQNDERLAVMPGDRPLPYL